MTTDPKPTTPLDEQRRDIQRALRVALFAVDDFVIGETPNMDYLTNAVRTRLTVEAALAYLIGTGLITVLPDEEWPELLPMRVPLALKPDTFSEARRARDIAAGLR